MNRFLQFLLLLPCLLMSAMPVWAQESRPFLMGFTRWPSDMSLQGIAMADTFIDGHADLVNILLDSGIPWEEALTNTPYSRDVQERLAYKVPAGKKLFVGATLINIGRNGLALNWGDKINLPLTGPWKDRTFNSPEVKTAYLNFLIHAVDTMRPDYLAIGIEANLLIINTPDQWAAYEELHRFIYQELKKRYPSLPLFATFELLALEGHSHPDKGKQHEKIRALMPYSDILALSIYPFMSYNVPTAIPDNFFDFAREFGKPIAISESGYNSQPVHYAQLTLSGSEELQVDFTQKLLASAMRDRYAFVITFATTDYERLIARLPTELQELAGVWKYTGLQTTAGVPKPALATWDKYFAMPYKP